MTDLVAFNCPNCGPGFEAERFGPVRDNPLVPVFECRGCRAEFGMTLVDLAAMERAGTHGYK